MNSSMKMYYTMKLTGKIFLVNNKNIEILVRKNELSIYIKNETNYEKFTLKFPKCESLNKLITENLDKFFINNRHIVYEKINFNKLYIFAMLDFLLTTINEVEFSIEMTSIECIRKEEECDPINIRKFITGLQKMLK